MSDEHVYRIVEFAGSSETGIEDAIEQAVGKAADSLEHLRWFEVVNMRGHIRDGRVAHYQVTLKLGFTLESTFRT